MKITNLSCTQFAGIRDRSIAFSDGINVVYGKNESGKSTLVNLISGTLFQNARIDNRKDKEFRDMFYPGSIKGSGVSGDFIDGKITFETPQGSYTLSKEWGSDKTARCILSTPNGVIREQRDIDLLLKDALVYGKGVYSEMLLSSQYNTNLSLKHILDASEKTEGKQELAEVVAQAFSESDGLSVDTIEQAINAKIKEIEGSHWDFERNRPDGGRHWSNGLGEIHKAYHTLQEAKAVLEEISRLESDADRTASDYAAKNAAAAEQEEKCEKFSTFANRLAVQSERKKTIDRIEKDRLKIAEVLSNWPKLAQEAQAAKLLQTEKANRELLDKYDVAKEITEGLKKVDMSALSLARPTDEEIARVKAARRSIVALENKLCGMNLNATIKMLGANSVEVVSLRSGKVLDVTDDSLSITEAVKITVPGVMEMQLTPADVDIEAVRKELSDSKDEGFAILGKYSVKTLDELEALAKKIDEVTLKVDNANNRLAMVLGTATFEELEAKALAIVDPVRPQNEIEREILLVAGNADIARYATTKETMVDGYVAEYGSINELKAKAYDLEVELQKAKESVAAAGDIPAEYLAVADPEEHLRGMQSSLKALQEQREAALANKTAAASRLEAYKEKVHQDPVATVEKAERAFEEQRSLLAHWKNILEVFNKQKELVHDNPMQDLADRFTKYLGIISGGKVSSEFPEGDKLAMSVYSGNRLMDYKKLSEGTKDTVSLAFRLAVLDHLFPQGGGVIVLDDPFTDMDAERTKQACALLQECAKQHQVIFLTCKEEYLEMLGGNHIMM